MKKYIFTLWLIGLCSALSAQITPPGLGKTNTGSWMALAVHQDLDSLKDLGWSSVTYFGIGRVSGPNRHYPLHRPGIFIANQEFKNRFRKNLEYSLAFSYRRQNEYSAGEPFEKLNPAIKQEFRLYGRFSYLFNTSFVTITPTLRQEFQKYYTPDFKTHDESFRLRSRFRLKFSFPLTPDKNHRILLFSEQLFSTSQMTNPQHWTPFGYKESRFAVYYSAQLKALPFQVNLGYMNDLVGRKSPFSAHYFAVDLIWKNPFTR